MSETDATASSTDETTGETSEEDTTLIGDAKAAEGDADKGETEDDADKKAASEEDGEDKKADEEGEKKDEGKDEPGPVILADLKFPEGFDRNEDALKTLTDALADEKLSPQERAQALVDLYTGGMQEAADAVATQWREERSKWVEATKALPKIGGDKLDASLGKIAKLIDEFGVTTDTHGVVSKELGEEFRQIMDDSGLGDHPTIVRFLVNVADAFSEGKPVSGDPAGSDRTQAQKMYPNMN